MSKDLPRNNIAFKNYSTVPQYDYDIKLPLKRLDTHIIKFENILDRNNAALNCEKGTRIYALFSILVNDRGTFKSSLRVSHVSTLSFKPLLRIKCMN
jgi:hypothetical protein